MEEELVVKIDGDLVPYHRPEKPRWYVVDIGRIVRVCDDEDEAYRLADELDLEVYPEEARILYNKRGECVE